MWYIQQQISLLLIQWVLTIRLITANIHMTLGTGSFSRRSTCIWPPWKVSLLSAFCRWSNWVREATSPKDMHPLSGRARMHPSPPSSGPASLTTGLSLWFASIILFSSYTGPCRDRLVIIPSSRRGSQGKLLPAGESTFINLFPHHAPSGPSWWIMAQTQDPALVGRCH